MQILTNAPNFRSAAISSAPAPTANPSPRNEAQESIEFSAAAAASKKSALIGTGIGAAAGLGLSAMASFGALGVAGTLVGLAAFGSLLGGSIGIQHEINAHPEKYPELSKRMRETLEAAATH